MINLDEQLKNLHNKLLQLAKQHELSQKENQQLKKEIEEMRAQLQEKTKTADSLKQNIDILKLSKSNLSENEKKELQKRIDIYLKEIENCLQLLNQ
ncbi:MAG: hypothetical protein ACR2FN_03680 [Chitinophagaceae bacterium]